MTSKFWAKTNWDFWTVDPDFDDDGIDCVMLRRELETRGAISLHPNGDRRNSGDDPVPLCSYVPDGGKSSSEFLSARLYLKEMQENHRYAKEAKQQRARDKEPAPLEAFLSPHAIPVLPELDAALQVLWLNGPVLPGIGRVWKDLVMISEDDIANANVENHDIKWTEVWRGRGHIVYKRDLAALGV